jgi:hypothetical protein
MHRTGCAFNLDGVVKTLHLLRCHKFSIISKYLLYVGVDLKRRAQKQANGL